MTGIESTRDVLLQVESLDAAVEFYGTTLGFGVFMKDASMVGLETGAFRLFLEPRPALGPVLELLADNFDDRKTALIEAGCVIVEDDPAIPRCYMRDPFGLVFNLGKA